MELNQYPDGFELALAGRTLLRHRAGQPAFFIGQGEPTVHMNHGHFELADYVVARIPLAQARVSTAGEAIQIEFGTAGCAAPLLTVRVNEEAQAATRRITIDFSCADPA